MTRPNGDNRENIHSATDRERCKEMGRRNGWRLKRLKPTRDPILKVDCVFDGEQTSFEDNRYDDPS
ncbi:MAG: hypothetical protein O3A14_19405 [Cyanobacteria bacterium]|nr:hypothetical protein [Cyanobacteriota bacterium]